MNRSYNKVRIRIVTTSPDTLPEMEILDQYQFPKATGEVDLYLAWAHIIP